MLVTSVKSDLEEAIRIVSRAVATRTTLPILTGISVEATGERLKFRATDLEIGVECSVPVRVGEEGNVVVPGKALIETIKNIDEGKIELISDKDGTELTISAEKTTYKLRTFPPGDFPQGRPVPEGKRILMKGSEFIDGVKKVAKSASRDETRLVLTGVYLETGKNSVMLAATDSYRLAVSNVSCDECPEGEVVIIPTRSMEEVSKICTEDELEIVLTENQAYFLQNNWVFYTRIIEGQFPAFKQLFPDSSDVNVEVKTKDLLDALRKVSVVLKGNPVTLEIQPNSMKIRAVSQDLGEAEAVIEARADKEISVTFNYVYLMDGIQNIKSEELRIELQEGLNPAVIRPLKEEDYSYLIMPIRNQ